MKPVVFDAEAYREFSDAVRYYVGIDAELGERLYEEIWRLIGDVREDPALYPLFDGDVRRHFSHVFPYAVLYLCQANRVVVVAVMNMKRKPGCWKQRLRRVSRGDGREGE